MTNKDSIQQKHLEAIKKHENSITDKNTVIDDFSFNDAATSCTTVTADAIGEAMEWLYEQTEYFYENCFWHGYGKEQISTLELVQLFLNQKAK
jgi:hypothetical protein